MSCTEKSETSSLKKELKLLNTGIEYADNLSVQKIKYFDKNKIFCKLINDVVEFYYNQWYTYDTSVTEFFNTLSNLGGQRTVNMIRSAMFLNQGRETNDDIQSCQMNLGGPSEKNMLQLQSGYATNSVVRKSL